MPNKAPDFDAATIETFRNMKADLQGRPHDCPPALWDALELPPSKAEVSGHIIRQQLHKHITRITLPDDHKGMLTSLVPLAVDAMVDVLTNPRSKGSEKTQVAQFLIDHDLGKAKQEVEHSGSLALEIRKQADAYLNARTVLPVKVVDKIDQAADDLVNEYMPDKYVVGKKASMDDGQEI